ncbi:MAG: hypothetical protein LCH96_02645 [Actinobacteria bacterium]|nr:hypothetical protein [Actinomycetota bacterium]
MGRDEKGSVLIEVVVAVPLLVLCTMLIVQGLVLTSGLGSIEVAAKDAARAAADSCSSVTPGTAARRAVPEFVTVREVDIERLGDTYQARVVAGLRYGVAHMASGEFEVSRTARMPRLDSCR